MFSSVPLTWTKILPLLSLDCFKDDGGKLFDNATSNDAFPHLNRVATVRNSHDSNGVRARHPLLYLRPAAFGQLLALMCRQEERDCISLMIYSVSKCNYYMLPATLSDITGLLNHGSTVVSAEWKSSTIAGCKPYVVIHARVKAPI